MRALASFLKGRNDYALARLEFALRRPGTQPPPILDRLPDASARTLHERWEIVEGQLDAARRFVARGAPDGDADATFARLQRIVRELDQYARALRWLLTVNERET